jgi:DNA-binding response OmpR family regulator
MNSQKKILIIDDDTNFSFGLRSVLNREGYIVISATTGQEGLQKARTEKIDIILCDVMMPPPNGIKLKIELSENPETAGIPFIFLTARMAQADRIAGLGAGADDFFTKPINIDELLNRIEVVLRQHAKAENEKKSKDQHGILKPKTPYMILEIPDNASRNEVNVAYKEKVKQYHPDRTFGLAQEIIALADERMKEINNAYNQLIHQI